MSLKRILNNNTLRNVKNPFRLSCRNGNDRKEREVLKMKFYDIESGKTITREQLFEEYKQNQKIMPDEYNYSFDEYVNNCLTSHNGTLEIIHE